jgi:serine-type D-Ala-D-Ala carboxypeptidase (penicillin-binding protein 5/6)
MNVRAEELKLASLHFKNATGLDLSPIEPGAVGSARDVSFLMAYMLKNFPDILEPTTLKNDRIYNKEGSFHEAENTNPIIDKIPHLLGSKTGYTDLAGGNLTIVFDAGFNHPIIITVLGSTYDDRFTDVVGLTNTTLAALEAASHTK